MYVCVKAKLTLVSFFYFFFHAPSPKKIHRNKDTKKLERVNARGTEHAQVKAVLRSKSRTC